MNQMRGTLARLELKGNRRCLFSRQVIRHFFNHARTVVSEVATLNRHGIYVTPFSLPEPVRTIDKLSDLTIAFPSSGTLRPVSLLTSFGQPAPFVREILADQVPESKDFRELSGLGLIGVYSR